MLKRKVGIRFLNSKHTRIFLGDSIKNATSILKRIAKENGWEIESKPDNINGNLVGWYYEIKDFCYIHIDDEDIVDEIRIENLRDHDIECDKELYSYDRLNEAGFSIIQSKDKNVVYSLNNVDELLEESRVSEKYDEKPVIFGNDSLYRIGFIINKIHNHLSSMVIKKYYLEYPFEVYKETNLTW